MALISPKAEVANPAGLAKDVQVGPFTYIGPDVTVAAGTIIAGNVTLMGKTSVGARCRLYPGCVVGCPPPSASEDAAGACTIGDGNVIREHVIVESGAEPNSPGSVLGANNLVMVGCQIAHDATLTDDGIFANFTRFEHHARVEPFVRTSGFTAVHAYATIGAYSFTTGYAGIDFDVPPYAIVQGVPSRVRCVNTENLRRCGFNGQAIEMLKGAFRILFNGEGRFPDPQRLQAAEEGFDNEHVRILVESLRRSAASPSGRCRQPAEDGG